MKPAIIRIYVDGGVEPYALAHSSDGSNFEAGIDLSDGTHTIRVTAQKVGESESDLSNEKTVIVGADTAPVITSHDDWTETITGTETITVQANSGETVKFFVNGAEIDSQTADGDGIATSMISFDSADLQGVNAVEIVTACRYINSALSHPSNQVRFVVTSGNVAASGVTTSRLLLTSGLLSKFRYHMALPWDNEVIAPGVISRALWRLNLGSGEVDGHGIVEGLPELHPLSYLGGLAPGYMDKDWLRNHIDRIAVDTVGKTAYHLKHDGSEYSAVPFWFDIALLAAAAYFRGDRDSYSAYKNKILEILSNLPLDSNGLVRHGVQYTMRLRNHGWSGTPTDHGASWYTTHTGGIGDVEGVTDPIYFPEVEGTARYVFATRLLQKMADLESDTDTSSLCDTYIANFQSAISSQINANNFLKQIAFPYGSNTENPGYAATAMAVVADAFSNGTEKSNALTALNNSFSGTNYRTGGTIGGDGSNSSPVEMGTIQYAGKNSAVSDVQTNAQYAFPIFTGPFVAAINQTDSAKARILGEDSVRFDIAGYQHGVFGWVGVAWDVHHGSADRWGHLASHFMVPSHATPSWLKEADGKYDDLSNIVVNGTQGSTANLTVPLGHRTTGFSVTASSSCTATIELYANEATNGLSALYAAGSSGTWPPNPTYGSDILMGSITITNGTTGSLTSGLKSYGQFSGGRLKVKVASVTGAPPANFTVTPHQAKINPIVQADPELGFADTFATDRFSSDDTDWTIMEGSKSTCSIQEREDTGPGGVGLNPLRKTEFKTTESINYTGMVQTQSLFADGWVMTDKVQRTDATVNSDGYPSIYPEVCAYFRVSPDKQTYIKVKTNLNSYYYRIVVEEWVNGSLVNTLYPADQDPYYDTFRYAERGHDERYLLVILDGNTVKGAVWDGGLMLPMSDGIGYGDTPYAWGTVNLTGAVSASGMAGFGVKGPCRMDAVRICGKQDQPIPPGFILDTGLDVPKTEIIIPSTFVAGEAILPASSKSCLRNEWGAKTSNVISDYNMRWSY